MANNEQSDAIEAVLIECLQKNTDYEEGDMLVEWGVVGFVTNPNSEKGDGYPVWFSNGELPTYRAKGLFIHALDKLKIQDLFNINPYAYQPDKTTPHYNACIFCDLKINIDEGYLSL